MDQKQNGKNGDVKDTENGDVKDADAGDNVPGVDVQIREQWSSKLDFMLSCIGFAVGLGNVWRFPYLAYKNGGGAFLVPYVIFLVGGGVPIFFLEIALGQFMSQGGYGAWKLVPIFKGIGIATTILVFLLNVYYIVILAWDVYYMVMAFNSTLPWSHCNNEWNTDRCAVSFDQLPVCNSSSDASEFINGTRTCFPANFTTVDPVVEFWENKVLEISPGVDQPDGFVWPLVLSLIFVWVLVYFCTWKGIKWTGKVVYFTATFPYIVLTILLVRGVTLEGATDGIIFYLKPDFSKLSDAQVWIDAGTQIFFSYAIGIGAMTALGSYNKFHNNFYKDCIIISCINSFTSLYAGIVVFSTLGFMAHQQKTDIANVAESGPGLAFIAYPKAVTQMGGAAPFWAVLFFFMIILLGLDSQFVGVEAFVTVCVDFFPRLRRGRNRELFTAGYCLVSCLLGLTMVTRGGMYVFKLFDYYSASGMSLLWICFFQCVAIAWVYGGRRFYDNIELMLGFRLNPYLLVCWYFVTPIITMGALVFEWVRFKPLMYNNSYVYPAWAQGLGMSMAFVSMICIPIFFVVKIIITPGTLQERWRVLTTPVLSACQVPSHWPDRHLYLVSSAKDVELTKTGVAPPPYYMAPDAESAETAKPLMSTVSDT